MTSSIPLLREAILRHWRGAPLEIASVADVPAGTGMGSSGSFTVALLKALSMARRIATTPQVLAQQACEIEIDILGEPVGSRTSTSPRMEAMCTYTFHRDGTVTVDPAGAERGHHRDLRNNLLLFYTGAASSASASFRPGRPHHQRGHRHDDNLHRIKEMGYRSAELLDRRSLRYASSARALAGQEASSPRA